MPTLDVMGKAINLLVSSPHLENPTAPTFASDFDHLLDVASDLVLQELPGSSDRRVIRSVLTDQLAIICSTNCNDLVHQSYVRQFEDLYQVQYLQEGVGSIVNKWVNGYPWIATGGEQPTINEETREFTHEHPELQFLAMIDNSTVINALQLTSWSANLVDWQPTIAPKSYADLISHGQNLLRITLERVVKECWRKTGVSRFTIVYNFSGVVPPPFGNPKHLNSPTICRSLPWSTLVLMPDVGMSQSEFTLFVHPSRKTCLVHTRPDALVKIELTAQFPHVRRSI